SISATRFSSWARDSEFSSMRAISISSCATAAAPGPQGEAETRYLRHRRRSRLPQGRRVLCSRHVIRTLEAERTLTSQRHATAGAIGVIPSGRALGAEVRGVDLRDLDAAAFARLMQAWHQHSVVLIREQTLSDQELIAFSRRLGDLDWAPIQETGRRFVEGLPEIYIVSNVKVNGEPIGSLGDGEAVWHTDMSYLDVP